MTLKFISFKSFLHNSGGNFSLFCGKAFKKVFAKYHLSIYLKVQQLKKIFPDCKFTIFVQSCWNLDVMKQVSALFLFNNTKRDGFSVEIPSFVYSYWKDIFRVLAPYFCVELLKRRYETIQFHILALHVLKNKESCFRVKVPYFDVKLMNFFFRV